MHPEVLLKASKWVFFIGLSNDKKDLPHNSEISPIPKTVFIL